MRLAIFLCLMILIPTIKAEPLTIQVPPVVERPAPPSLETDGTFTEYSAHWYVGNHSEKIGAYFSMKECLERLNSFTAPPGFDDIRKLSAVITVACVAVHKVWVK